VAAVIAPTIDALLSGIADALADTVVTELPPSYARTQVEAAVTTLRRAAHVWDKLAPTIDADNRDIGASLLSMDLPAAVHDRVRHALAPDDGFPTVERLSATNRALQEILLGVPDSPELRALLARMVERERGLNVRSWSAPQR
jgi:hypothetical protein